MALLMLRSLCDKYGVIPGRGVCVFEPTTMMMGATMGMQAIGGAIGAAGTMAGGNMAKTAGLVQKQELDYRAAQLRSNEGGEIGAAQRQMLDTQLKTKELTSEVTARAAANGVNAGVGSPVTATSAITQRGTYHAMMDLWNGQNRAVGLENQAKGLEYSGDVAQWEGEQKKKLSRYQALATLAGAGASMGQTYGAFKYGPPTGRPTVSSG